MKEETDSLGASVPPGSESALCEEDEECGLTTLDACPECGNYYVLYETSPALPLALEYGGTPQEQDEWEAEHCYNIIRCSVCSFRSDED